jgi:hypothetical protein
MYNSTRKAVNHANFYVLLVVATSPATSTKDSINVLICHDVLGIEEVPHSIEGVYRIALAQACLDVTGFLLAAWHLKLCPVLYAVISGSVAVYSSGNKIISVSHTAC